MALERLDYIVAKSLGVSRSAAVKLVKGAKVKLAGKTINKSSRKFETDVKLNIDYKLPVQTSDLNIPIIYEDKYCVVIDKPAGILTHSKGEFNSEPNVASWLESKTTGFSDNNRAGIVHRLDRGTSGVMICAKSPDALSHFQNQFSSRKVKKTYFALIEGRIDPAEAVIDIPIERNPKDPKRFKTSSNGKKANTHYKTAKTFTKNKREFSLLELTPKTGRTHQLRVHLTYMKHPIVGDDFYSGIKAKRLYLHAYSLEITLPGGIRKIFTVDLPDSFSRPKILSDV